MLSFPSESKPTGLQVSNKKKMSMKPKVKATRKLNFQQQEAKHQQNRSILDKYSNFMNSREVMTDSENLENIDNHERRLDLDDTFLIDPREKHYFETEISLYESSPQREKIARHKDNSESMDVNSRRISESRSLTQGTPGVSTARSRSLPLESERTRPTQGLSAESNCTPVPVRPNQPQIQGDARYIHLGANTRMHVDIWETIKLHSDSRFVRGVLQKLSGMEELQKKCLDEEKANKGKENIPEEEYRRPLTPEKIEILKDCLYEKIKESGVTGKTRALRMKK